MCVCAQVLSHVQLFVLLFATPWTIAHQAPLSMGFPRQEYWIELPFPTPGDLPHLGIKSRSPVLPVLAGRVFTTEPPEKPLSRLRACVLSRFSCVQFCDALSLKFSRQEYWSGLPYPPAVDLPHPGIELVSPAFAALAGRFFTTALPDSP